MMDNGRIINLCILLFKINLFIKNVCNLEFLLYSILYTFLNLFRHRINYSWYINTRIERKTTIYNRATVNLTCKVD